MSANSKGALNYYLTKSLLTNAWKWTNFDQEMGARDVDGYQYLVLLFLKKDRSDCYTNMEFDFRDRSISFICGESSHCCQVRASYTANKCCRIQIITGLSNVMNLKISHILDISMTLLYSSLATHQSYLSGLIGAKNGNKIVSKIVNFGLGVRNSWQPVVDKCFKSKRATTNVVCSEHRKCTRPITYRI